MNEFQRKELQRLFTKLENSASTESSNLEADEIIISRSALMEMAEAFGTWPELNDGPSKPSDSPTDQPERRMLVDAICAGLTDLLCDVRSDETESTLALGPQVRDLGVMAERLRARMSRQ
jgi:hypothetical protein